MSESIGRIQAELEALGYETSVFNSPQGRTVSFPYTVEAGSHKGKQVTLGISFQGTEQYPEYPPPLDSCNPSDRRWDGRCGCQIQREWPRMGDHEQTSRGNVGSVADKAYERLPLRTSQTLLEQHMSFEVVFTAEADSTSRDHLLQHYRRNERQEDLCFALWRPSTGKLRHAALIDEIILPHKGDRILHGNTSFEPDYLTRAIKSAREKNTGLAFMHSHPSHGWQGMSPSDVEAERDVLAYPAGATGLPLVGLTIGSDGYWSARFWKRTNGQMQRYWCEKVRVVGPQSYELYFNDDIAPPPPRRDILKRTFDTWGREAQQTISRLKIGIVGLGSVGCIVAEAIARMGVAQVTLIDPDKVEEHNLDRLLYGTVEDIGKLKVELAARAMRRNATAESIRITTLPVSLHHNTAYETALDCDVIFSCVDRPVPRDVLNYIAQAHLIPVIDGGIAVETDRRQDRLFPRIGAHISSRPIINACAAASSTTQAW